MNKVALVLILVLLSPRAIIGQAPFTTSTADEHIIITNLNSQNISLKHTIGTGFEAWFVQKETIPDTAQLLSVAATISYSGSNFPFKGTARIIIDKPPIKIDTNITFNTNLTTPRSFASALQVWEKAQIKHILSPYYKRDASNLEPLVNKTLEEIITRWKRLIVYIKDATNSQLLGNPIKMQEGKLKNLARELKDF